MELGTHRLLDLTHTAAAPLLAGTGDRGVHFGAGSGALRGRV